MRETVYASFADSETAAKVVGSLLDHGVKPEDLSILIKNMPVESDRDDAPNERIPGDAHDVRVQAEQGVTVTTTEDAVSGAMKGAGVGLGVGALAALAAVTVPGFGIVLGGGALAAAMGGLVGAGAAGAMAGAITGYLKDQGVDLKSAERFSQVLESGGSLVSVSVPSGNVASPTVIGLFEKYGGHVGSSTPPLQQAAPLT